MTISGEDYIVSILQEIGVEELVILDNGLTAFDIEGTRFYFVLNMTEDDNLTIAFTCSIAEGLDSKESLLKAVAYKNPSFASVCLEDGPDKTSNLFINADLLIGLSKDADITAISYLIKSMRIQIEEILGTWGRVLT